MKNVFRRILLASLGVILVLSCPKEAFSQQGKQSSLDKVCDNLDQLATVSGSLTNLPFKGVSILPNGQPTPTFLMAAFSSDNIYLEMCQLYQKLKHLDLMDASRVLVDVGDEIFGTNMGEKMDDLEMAMDMKASYDRSKKMSPNSMDRLASMGGRINKVLGRVNKGMESNSGKKSDTFANKGTKEANMRKMMMSQKRISLVSDLTKCSHELDSYSGDSYSLDDTLKIDEIGYLDGDIELLSGTISEMMIEAETNYERYEKYLNDLNTLIVSYVSYESREGTFLRESREMVSTNKKDKPKEVKKKLKTTYQIVSTSSNEDILTNFRKKYGSIWKDVRINAGLTSAPMRGILTRGFGEHAEKGYAIKNFECRYSKIYRDTKEENPRLFVLEIDNERDRILLEKRDACLGEEKKEDTGNLMEYYIDVLGATLRELKKLQAEVWTADSYFNGSVRIFNLETVENDSNSPQSRESVLCSKELSQMELEKTRLEQKDVENELRMNYLEEKIKRTHMMEDEAKERELQEEIRKRDMARDAETRNRASKEIEINILPRVNNSKGF